jgi:hypothetical protein
MTSSGEACASAWRFSFVVAWREGAGSVPDERFHDDLVTPAAPRLD